MQGCNEVKVLGKTKPTCPEATPDVPSRPENLTYVFIIANKVRSKTRQGWNKGKGGRGAAGEGAEVDLPNRHV